MIQKFNKLCDGQQLIDEILKAGIQVTSVNVDKSKNTTEINAASDVTAIVNAHIINPKKNLRAEYMALTNDKDRLDYIAGVFGLKLIDND